MVKEVIDPVSFDVIEVIGQADLDAQVVNWHYNPEGRAVEVSDPTAQTGMRRGELYARLQVEITKAMPGSVVSTRRLLEELDFEAALAEATRLMQGEGVEGPDYEAVVADAERLLQGDSFAQECPIFELGCENWAVHSYWGGTNLHLQEMSRIAAEALGQDNDRLRAEYQGHLLEIMRPVLRAESTYDYRLVDDCGASAYTLAAQILFMKEAGLLEDGKTLRIDLAMITPQALLLLRKTAQDNEVGLDLHVGVMMGAKLSEGVEHPEGYLEHANYIRYLPDMGMNYEDIVGDMGDLMRSLSKDYDDQCPWNRHRYDDEHGLRGNGNGSGSEPVMGVDPNIIFFANGGYGMRAMMRYLSESEQIEFDESQAIMIGAKRIWSPDLGYGVLLFNIPQVWKQGFILKRLVKQG